MVVEYDGTNFSGWQEQKRLAPRATVQGALREAIERMVRHPIDLFGASRTDAGVHARGQVVAFSTERDQIPLVGFERGLGQFLPPNICVREVAIAEAGWDPRRSSRGKRYRYTFWNAPTPSALDRRRAWWVRGELDLDAMRLGAQRLVGTHDFEAFRSAQCSAKHAVRTMYRLSISRGEHRRVQLDVVGNAFCRNMVRIIAGNLCEVGLGRRSPESLSALIESRDRSTGGQTAPPQGLCLEEVIYDDRLPPRPKQDRDLLGEAGYPLAK